jgi:hypothetical protein
MVSAAIAGPHTKAKTATLARIKNNFLNFKIASSHLMNISVELQKIRFENINLNRRPVIESI